MQVHEAFAEFAHLLSVASAAMENVIGKIEPSARHRAKELLNEVEAIGSRLHEIASELERLGLQK